MSREENNCFEITSSYVTFESSVSEVDLSQERIDELKQKNILALPIKNYHGKEGFFFFGGTRQFYMFCQEFSTDQHIDFCIEKSQYLEIDLNSVELFLGTFLISSIAIPIFVNLISDFIKSKLADKNDKITINIIINNIYQNNSSEIYFKGTREDFENKVIKTLSTYDEGGNMQLSNNSGNIVDVLS
jgi:hypothetical protein